MLLLSILLDINAKNMKNQQLSEVLHDLGLSENEAQVYVTSLSLGPTTILKIAKSSQIRRTTVYSVIETLKNKGLMHIKPAGLKQLYVAEHPDRLENIIESKKRALQKLLPEFQALYNLKGGESTVKYYEGLSAVKNIYETILDPLKPGDDYLVIGDIEKFFSNADKKFFEDFLEKRIKSRVKARLLVIESDRAHNMKQFARNMNHEVKILPLGSKLSVDTMIVPGKVTIFNMEEPISAISLENNAMVEMHKELFEIIWRSIPEET
jgi:sugar-specific transcriptional regulator TrmB